MSIVVQKFGGTSVGSVEKITNVASMVYKEKKMGHDVVVVVSAMGTTTDDLLQLANNVSTRPNKREMDMLLSTGEQVTISLLTMALQEQGIDAVSLTGWQAGIETESFYGNARIKKINVNRIKKLLQKGKTVVVAGFQGTTQDGEITTLGRGGSDTTATALAAALKAKQCDIYTDVDGVYTSDPKTVKEAKKFASITYDEMLILAKGGAEVVHPRAIAYAKDGRIPIVVRSSFEQVEGTLIGQNA